jgi:hypothetical protein
MNLNLTHCCLSPWTLSKTRAAKFVVVTMLFTAPLGTRGLCAIEGTSTFSLN